VNTRPKFPSFTAEAALSRGRDNIKHSHNIYRNSYSASLVEGQQQQPHERKTIVPQQEQCEFDDGACTSQFFSGTRTQCASAGGVQHCCSNPGQYPWVRVCTNPTTGERRVSRGCGVCVW
jgi:hypothetical protein